MNARDVALAVLVTVIWGFNFVAIKIGLDAFPPLLFSAVRFAVAAVPLVFFIGRPPVAWRWILLIGLFLGILKFSFLFIGMDRGMPAGLSSLVLQSQAFFTALLAALVLKERLSMLQTLGMVIAFGGIAVIGSDAEGVGSLFALGLVILAGLCWGASNITMKLSGCQDVFKLIVWVSIVPPLPLLALSWIFEGPTAIESAFAELSFDGLWSTAYVAYISTLFGFGIWAKLLGRYSASVVAPFTLLVPIFGMASAALVLGEQFDLLKILGAALVLLGLSTIVFARKILAFIQRNKSLIAKS